MPRLLVFLPIVLLGWAWPLSAHTIESDMNPRDVLEYHDGDRVQGRLVEKTEKLIIFQSDRFGELRVPADKAVVILADKPVEPKPAEAKAVAQADAAGAARPALAPGSAASAEAERLSLIERFSPALLTAKLREFFGPWHGKFAFALETVSDTAERNNDSVEMLLKRKWTTDEVQVKGRYDFSETNNIPTTDVLKADGLWRHDFQQDRFALYRPSVEWNRASFNNGVPNDYFLMQQEIGLGVGIVTKPHEKVRIGASENLFDVWNTTPGGAHTSRTVESAFVETELTLPWRMSLTQRGVYYYSFASKKDGWENRIELSKKFTETLSTSIRQEMRRYNPDGTTQDYTRLKLLFGVDF